MAINAALTTTLHNPTDSEQVYPFVPPHGIKLDAGKSVSVPGDIIARLGSDPRKLEALQYCLDNNLLSIRNTPPAMIWDDTDNLPQVVKIAGGVVSAADPFWISAGESSA